MDATTVAKFLSCPLYIASAGLGLVSEDENVPAYDATVAEVDSPLSALLARMKKGPADWWLALVTEWGPQRSIRGVLRQHKDALVLLALPSTYLSLVSKELDSLSNDEVSRLRIFTSTRGASVLSNSVRSSVLPYDERLEGSEYRGTRTDFPQRALRHFVEVLSGHALSLQQAKVRVADTMQSLQKPAAPARDRRSDEEIRTLVRENWERFGGSSTRLLRYLRDDALVSC
ncbi:hypothetical protein ACNRC9_05470, partial [Ralstonia pseudosolanacearum]|uniref:hypothetical protein n=1 Tax=Ralstonia pseudosolanacearum TaxID=1310165 RepID=UPI003AACB398